MGTLLGWVLSSQHWYAWAWSIVLFQSNILITDDGKACLCDFGLSSIVAELQGTSYLTSTIGGAVRWAAAELFCIQDDDNLPTITTHSDIYSFGSVMLEVCHAKYLIQLHHANMLPSILDSFWTNPLSLCENRCSGNYRATQRHSTPSPSGAVHDRWALEFHRAMLDRPSGG